MFPFPSTFPSDIVFMPNTPFVPADLPLDLPDDE